MCGRFTLSFKEKQLLADKLGIPVEELDELDIPRYNIAPTDKHVIVRLQREDMHASIAKWGLVNTWAKDAKRAAAQINARSESLQKTPAFRDAFAKRRCVVPADGYYEWTGTKEDRRPVWYHREDGGLILLAGLYESWHPEPDTWQRTFTIITTNANDVTSPVHDRMPVILQVDAVEEWLYREEKDLEKLQALLKPAPNDLLVPTMVSQRVNSVKNDDASLLEEAPPPLPRPTQGSLL
jgi:putative SOS response-associated peptidase YedK